MRAIFAIVILILMWPGSSSAQQQFLADSLADSPSISLKPATGIQSGRNSAWDNRFRLLLDTEVGNENSLGYKFPSIGLGPSIEIPTARHFEFQAAVSYSPDRKVITNDGQSLKLTGSVLGFATNRLGFVGTIERSSLWTSQFNEKSWLPSAGVVVRNDYFGPGRLYVTYVFPTGCVWATAGNPCTLQSKRLQGIEIRQDVRSASHMRWGFTGGLYHFCDQGNPNDPQAGRSCHLAATALATVRFEFHLGHRTHFVPSGATDSDNF